MADDNGNSNGDKRNYLRICGLWKNGKMLVSNNLQKRIDRQQGNMHADEHYKEDANVTRLTVMENQFRKGLMSQDADGHLLLDVEDYDLFLEYLEIVKSDYDAKVAQK